MKKYNNTYCVGKFPQLTRRVFTTADGLKSNNITAMCFDKKGVLFIGTDKGLSKFDGEKFVPFDVGCKDAAISMIAFDEKNYDDVMKCAKAMEVSKEKTLAGLRKKNKG